MNKKLQEFSNINLKSTSMILRQLFLHIKYIYPMVARAKNSNFAWHTKLQITDILDKYNFTDLNITELKLIITKLLNILTISSNIL